VYVRADAYVRVRVFRVSWRLSFLCILPDFGQPYVL